MGLLKKLFGLFKNEESAAKTKVTTSKTKDLASGVTVTITTDLPPKQKETPYYLTPEYLEKKRIKDEKNREEYRKMTAENAKKWGKSSEEINRILSIIDNFDMDVEFKPIKYTFDEIYDEKFAEKFDRKYDSCDNKCADLIDKITRNDNPDQSEKYIIPMLKQMKKFKTFCYSHGDYGVDYYQDMCGDDLANLRKEVENYYRNEYPNDKADFEEEREYKAHVEKIRADVVKGLKKGTVREKDFINGFDKDDKSIVRRKIKDLIAEGLVIKGKDGRYNTLIYKK